MGVYAGDLTGPLARSLGNLGAVHAFVVHGMDGLDEITITNKTADCSEFVQEWNGERLLHPSWGLRVLHGESR